ncbi:MAG: serine/threonine-protein phosphatase [Betaproteobacteria bacterium]|nr:serine/threonine-protein phosphatase [Betaproteobacteria bacterium]
MQFTIYQESRIGKRKNNEDRLAHSYSRDALLIVLADGMGGHYYGEVAAQIAVQTMVDTFKREANPIIADPFLFLQKNIYAAHQSIIGYSTVRRLSDTPRTTIVACLIQNNVAHWVHAGDSRLYLIRNGTIVSRTRDHSIVQHLLETGKISPEQAEDHPDRNRIYSCLGGPQFPDLDLSHKTPLMANDLIIICSDGIWGVLPNENIIAQSLHLEDFLKAAPRFMDRVESISGSNGDNLSMLAVRWEEDYVGDSSSFSVSTHGMSATDVTTHMEIFGNMPREDFSNDDIERAIEEIRAAIDKYSFKK